MVTGCLMLENLGGGGPSPRPSPRFAGRGREGERARAPSRRSQRTCARTLRASKWSDKKLAGKRGSVISHSRYSSPPDQDQSTQRSDASNFGMTSRACFCVRASLMLAMTERKSAACARSLPVESEDVVPCPQKPELAVCLAAMTNGNDVDKPLPVDDSIHDTPFADSDAPQIGCPLELSCTSGARTAYERFNAIENARSNRESRD